MTQTLTDEQQHIVDTIQKDDCELLLVDSIAGSGKSFILKQIEKVLNPRTGLYVAFNKSVATEAKNSFPDTIDCRTIHSYAYSFTVAPMNLSIGFFGHSNIKERMDFLTKVLLVDLINQFLLSRFIKIQEFITEYQEDFTRLNRAAGSHNIEAMFDKYVRQIVNGTNGTTHNAYVKLFHMLLASGDIQSPEYDVAFFDEGADANEVAIEIFRLIKAKKKIIAFDAAQAIYSFTHCISCADAFKGEGTTLHMSTTYRCRPTIANKIQNFMQKHHAKSFTFVGTEPADDVIRSIMYLSRTNSGMVGKMIELIDEGTKFKLLREPKNVFELLLILMNLKQFGKIYNVEWRHLQEDVDEFFSDPFLQDEYTSVLQYISKIYEDDVAIKSASAIIFQYGNTQIYNAYEYAKAHFTDKASSSVKLSTIFTAKGDEADRVVLLADINMMVEKALKAEVPTPKTQESIRLAYVAYSRATKELINAQHL